MSRELGLSRDGYGGRDVIKKAIIKKNGPLATMLHTRKESKIASHEN